ncbi:MAG: hypothetical protein KKF78_06255 [Candidatus Omnitrophica bacterium]|nr:hypothetical protein [Candidatus Omnitrophota bacterium]MBU1996738.1 hypothetical protein [Candidatus Omnitrophota bacterium]
MEKMLRIVFVLSLVIGMSSGAVISTFAQQAEEAVAQETEEVVVQEEQVAVQEAEEAIEEIVGEIISIDSERSSIRVKYLINEEAQEYKTSNFSLNETSTIEKDDQVITLADLKEGNSVVIKYAMEEGWRRIVNSIIVENTVEE